MAFTQRARHAVEGTGQFTELITARDGDAVLVLASLEFQDSLVHGRHRPQQIANHAAPVVNRRGQRKAEEATERNDQRLLQTAGVGEPSVHRVE